MSALNTRFSFSDEYSIQIIGKMHEIEKTIRIRLMKKPPIPRRIFAPAESADDFLTVAAAAAIVLTPPSLRLLF